MTENTLKNGDIILGSSSNVGFGVFIPGGREGLEKWAENYAKNIKPCAHTIKETEEYLLSMYDAVQLEAGNDQLQNFEHNVILNNFRDKLKHQPLKMTSEMSDEEMDRWHLQEMAASREIDSYPPEHFGIITHGYYLPHTQRNEAFYEDVYKKEKARRSAFVFGSDEVEKDYLTVYIFFEETTETINASAALDLLRKLLIYQGVTQKDIDELTPRFVTYVSLSKDM